MPIELFEGSFAKKKLAFFTDPHQFPYLLLFAVSRTGFHSSALPSVRYQEW